MTPCTCTKSGKFWQEGETGSLLLRVHCWPAVGLLSNTLSDERSETPAAI